MHDLSLGRRAQHVKAQIEDALAYTRRQQPPMGQQPQQPAQQQPPMAPQPSPLAQMGPAAPQMPPRSQMPSPTPQQGALGSLAKQPQSFARGGLVRSVQSRNFPV